MQATKITDTHSMRLSRTFEYVPVASDVVAFRDEQRLEPADPSGPVDIAVKLRHTVREGFSTLTKVKAHLKTGETLLTEHGVVLCSPETLTVIASRGFVGGMTMLDNFKERSTPFTALAEGAAKAEHVVRLDVASHMLFALDGTVLPSAIYFDYMSGRMDNTVYDLDKAVAVLAEHPRVRSFDAAGNEGKPQVQRISYFNADDKRTRSLNFWFEPTPEEAIALWDWQTATKAKYPSTKVHEAVFALDLLGLRKAGAARFDSYWGCADDEAV